MKDEFDSWLKTQWARKDFPVDPDHRAAMERMLPVQKRRRVIAWWWWGGGMAVGFILFMLLVPGMHPLMRTQQPATSPVPESNTPVHNETPDAARDLQSVEVAGAADAQTPDPHIPDVSADHPHMMQDGAGRTGDEPGIASTETKSTTSTGPGSPAIARTTPGNITTESAADTRRKEADRKTGAADQPLHDLAIPDPETPATERTPLTQAGSGNGIDAKAGARESSATAFAGEADPPLMRPVVMVPEIDPVALHLTVPAPASPAVQSFEASARNGWYAFAEAGGSYVPAMANTVLAGHVLAAGMGVGIQLTPSLDLQALGGYALQDGGFRFERMSTVRQPGFGARSSFHELTPERLHFVQLKIGAVYRLRRHLLMARGGGMYLYGAEGTVTVQTADQLQPMLIPTTTSGWLNTSGMRHWHWTGEAAYGYQLAPRWSVLAGAAWRPGDIAQADVGLSDAGYSWQGRSRSVHPFVSMQYRIYGN